MTKNLKYLSLNKILWFFTHFYTIKKLIVLISKVNI